jgi:hypothetical protein
MIKELLPYPQYKNKWHFKYWITFTGEAILNPKFTDYTGGRLEVYIDKEQYAINEYRFLTNKKSFWIFRDLVECRHVNIIGLYIIKLIIKHYYYDKK